LYNPSTKRIWCYCCTVAEGKKYSRIRKDLQNLLSRWTAMCKITNRSSSVKILGELNRASSILETFNDTSQGIQIDDEELYNQTKDYLQEIASKQSIVKFYQS
jgi:ribonuclease G